MASIRKEVKRFKKICRLTGYKEEDMKYKLRIWRKKVPFKSRKRG